MIIVGFFIHPWMTPDSLPLAFKLEEIKHVNIQALFLKISQYYDVATLAIVHKRNSPNLVTGQRIN
jgi:hypothetical protein